VQEKPIKRFKVKPTFQILLITLLIFSLLGSCSSSSTPESYVGYGADHCVSGSLHIITLDGDKIILDAGSFYGEDGKSFPQIDQKTLTDVSAIIISHAHIDHIGRLITSVVKMGYKGPIYCTGPTKELMPTMLKMASKYGDFGKETFFFSKRSQDENRSSGKNTAAHLYADCPYGSQISPKNKKYIICSSPDLEDLGYYFCSACAQKEANEVMKQVIQQPLHLPFQISKNVTAEFLLTPHLPGSVMVLLKGEVSGHKILYTGDVGSGLSPFLPSQDPPQSADVVITEATYGTSTCDIEELKAQRENFRIKLGELVQNGKRIIIPAFVLDRSQQILYEINQGKLKGEIPQDTPIKVFGNSVEELNEIYLDFSNSTEYSPYFSAGFLENGPFPHDSYLSITGTTLSKLFDDPEERRRSISYGEIGICSSGMADNSLSLEFVKQWISDPDTVFIFVGYQDPETIGGELVEGLEKGTHTPSSIIIDGNSYQIKADILKYNCFSGHAEFNQITNFLHGVDGLKTILIVHTDQENVDPLIQAYKKEFPSINIVAPQAGQLIALP